MFETFFTIEGSKRNIAIVVIIITVLVSSMVVPIVSGLPITVPEVSVAVLTASGLM